MQRQKRVYSSPKFASHVTILIRDDDFSCAKSCCRSSQKNHPKDYRPDKIPKVICVEGDHMLRRICYRNRKYRKRKTLFEFCKMTRSECLYLQVMSQTHHWSKELVNLDPHGYVITDKSRQTKLPRNLCSR